MGQNVLGSKEPPKTQKEIVREQTRTIDRANRKIEREIKNLGRQEAKQLKEIKTLAGKGQHGPAKIVAKSVATTRKHTANLYNMSANLKSISMQLSASGTQMAVMESLSGATKVMGKVNEDMNI